MKILIIGGTRFLGRHLVAAALTGGHEVTLFNRGQHSPTTQPDVESIIGDRNTDLSKLQNRRWDAVVDTCGDLPGGVRTATEWLSSSVERYVFISSISVYADLSLPGVDEFAPLKQLSSEQLERVKQIESSGETSANTYGDMYGGLKALCEQVAENTMPDRVLIIRPGLIVGPYDYTDRFTYWVARVARGGEVLAPGRTNRPVQFIDARDLAEWTVKMVKTRETGIYNTNGLPNSLTMKNLLDECALASGSDASFTWVDEEFIKQEEVAAWSELPLWLPESADNLKGFMFVSSDKALKTGLNFREFASTVHDTLSWYREAGDAEPLKAGLSVEREQSLLRKWHATRY